MVKINVEGIKDKNMTELKEIADNIAHKINKEISNYISNMLKQ